MTNSSHLAPPAVHGPGKCFMLVHGAWHGAWVWQQVAACLREQGHVVYTPTLTGLGERADLLSADVTLDTFIDDIEQAILHPQSAESLAPQRDASPLSHPGQLSDSDSDDKRNTSGQSTHEMAQQVATTTTYSENAEPAHSAGLTDVILVGHSFAGPVITAVAGRIPEQINRLIYLDAFLLNPGQSTFDTLPEKVILSLRHAAEKHGGWGIPAPDPVHLGIPTDHAAYSLVRDKLTPHPLNSYSSRLSIDAIVPSGVNKCYLACTEPEYKPVAAAHAWVQSQPDWRFDQVASSHSAPVLIPEQLAQKLLELASK